MGNHVPAWTRMAVAHACERLKAAEFYTLNGRTVWDGSSISIKLLKKEERRGKA